MLRTEAEQARNGPVANDDEHEANSKNEYGLSRHLSQRLHAPVLAKLFAMPFLLKSSSLGPIFSRG